MIGEFSTSMRRGFIILAAVVTNGILLLGIGSAFVFLNSGADRSSILHLDTEIKSVYRPYIQLASGPNDGRQIDSTARAKLVSDYLNAWYTRNEAFRYNEPILLRDYYTDSAYAKLRRNIELNRISDVSVRQTTLAHNIRVEFYSEDGKLAALSDQEVQAYKQVWRNDALLSEGKDMSNYQVVLILEDDAWRIRHILRTPSHVDANMVERKSEDVASVISGIKGVNYYPKEQPWNMFGADFNLATIRSDFERIRVMGLNTIRVFVPYQDFGGPDLQSVPLDQLRLVMDTAEDEGIGVMLTLFDFYGDYDLADWTLCFQHARSLVNAFKEHPALIAWDIKNEPDLDFDSRGKNRVLAWLKEMVAFVNSLDKEHPVTIGWSSAETATQLVKEVDVVSFHYYGATENFRSALKELKNNVPLKPILLQEYGLSSYSGFWNIYSGSENKQASHHKAIQEVVSEHELPFLFWTLYDFPEVPEKVVGRLPWRRIPQKNYGCLDIEGNPKEAYTFISQQ